MSTLNNFPTEATDIQDADLMPIKRGTGTNSDKKITGANIKAQFATAAQGALADSALQLEDTDLVKAMFDVEVPEASQVEMEAGIETDVRQMTPERVAQAIAALSGGVGTVGVYIAAAHNAAAGQAIYVNRASAYTITFPASPENGDFVILIYYSGSPSNVISLDFQGKNLNGTSSAGAVFSAIAEFQYLSFDTANDTWRSKIIFQEPELPASGPLNNFTATTNPGVSDDNTAGYSIGSLIFNTVLGLLWRCYDASTSAADWQIVDNKLAGIRVVSGTTDTLLASDSGKLVIYTHASGCAVTLPDTFSLNWHATIIWAGTAAPTVTRSGTDTINGAATGVTPAAKWKGMYLVQYAAGTYLALK